MTRELTSCFACYTPSNVLSMGWCPSPELCFELVYVQNKHRMLLSYSKDWHKALCFVVCSVPPKHSCVLAAASLGGWHAFVNAWAVMLTDDQAFFKRKPKLLFLGSLTVLKDEAFLKTLSNRDQTGLHLLTRGMTYMLQALYAGVGRTFKWYIAQKYDAWLLRPATFHAIVEGRVKATDKRVLITQFIGESWDMLCGTFNVGRAFQKTGMGIGASVQGGSFHEETAKIGRFFGQKLSFP